MPIIDQKIAFRRRDRSGFLRKFKGARRQARASTPAGGPTRASRPKNTVEYYQSVVNKMGKKDGPTFARLFMVPGMGHCPRRRRS